MRKKETNAGADLYCFAQDQFARLVQAGALNPLGVKAAEAAIEANDPGVVAAATSGETLYAYPMTSGNGCFRYYDKSVILEGLIAVKGMKKPVDYQNRIASTG